MFGARTKYCKTVLGQKRTSRAASEVNADATAAVATVTKTPTASAKTIRTQGRDMGPNEKENGACEKRCDMDGKPEGCFRGKKTS